MLETKNGQININEYKITSWIPEESKNIFEILEKPNWAPWLAASEQALAGRAKVFPEGQLVLKNVYGLPMASLSTNKINWDGNSETLPCWDEVAGDPTTYENTYKPNGNTIVLMSMNVGSEFQGSGLARKMIEKIKTVAQDLKAEHLIGSFRPNQFGKYKSQSGKEDTDFTEYCMMKREDGLPIDGWLRSLTRNGMQSLTVDKKAMTVIVPIDEFKEYQKTYCLNMWKEIFPNIWECGEVGYWLVNKKKGIAVYRECNLWGALPIK